MATNQSYSDVEYVLGILYDNLEVSTHFYKKNRDPFIKYIKSRFSKLSSEYICEIYGTSCSCLYEQIFKENLRVEGPRIIKKAKKDSNEWIPVTLRGYLYGIGYRKAIDLCREMSIPIKTKSIGTTESNTTRRIFNLVRFGENLKSNSVFTGYEDLENEYEQNPEWAGILYEDENEEKERLWSTLQQAMDKISKKCNDIFTMYYWDKVSMNIIADTLGYSSAKTAKAQKWKCMENLKSFVNTLLKEEK
ncbi:MAG: sigma-70 family RNA polymerase sigma factor [Alistipes sp.]|nr:sigma-70 family RNA polymerase sigma factor [Alistipes sp.]